MEPSVSPLKTVLRSALPYGLVAGALCIVWVVGLHWTGANPYGPKRLMAIFVPPLAVLAGQWRLRRLFGSDGPGLVRSVGAGLLITVVAAAVSAGGVYGFARLTGPAPIARHLVEMRQLLEQAKPQFLKEKGGLRRYEETRRNLAYSPQDLATDDYKNKLLFGFLMSIPGGIFLRK